MLEFIWNHAWVWFGAGGITIIALLAVAYFIPGARMAAVEIIAGIIAAGTIYGKGARDAKKREQARQAAAEAKSIADAKADRAAADRDVASGVPDGGDRDK